MIKQVFILWWFTFTKRARRDFSKALPYIQQNKLKLILSITHLRNKMANHNYHPWDKSQSKNIHKTRFVRIMLTNVINFLMSSCDSSIKIHQNLQWAKKGNLTYSFTESIFTPLQLITSLTVISMSSLHHPHKKNPLRKLGTLDTNKKFNLKLL